MATIIIENKPKKSKRPNTTDSTMFVSFDGTLYSGYYLTAHQRTALEVLKCFNQLIKSK